MIKEIISRLFSKTPKTFRIIRNAFATLSALAAFVIALQTNGVELPNWLSAIFEWEALIGGALASFVAQLTKVWTDSDGTVLNEMAAKDETVNPDKIQYPKKKF